MNVAVIGASGSVGRSVCTQLLDTHVLGPTDRLQLVGHRGGTSETGIFGLRIDLLDAFSLTAPTLEPILDAERIDADIVVMVAGDTPPPDPRSTVTRDHVALTNIPVFEHYAKALADHNPDALVIVQSNPVELAVDIFAEHLGSRRVVGAGAYNDSIRFRREIAADLTEGAYRPMVSGYVLGEHGLNCVPAWSTVQVHGVPEQLFREYLASTAHQTPVAQLVDAVTTARARLGELIADGHGNDAFNFVHSLPADVRSLVKPWFAHWSGRTSTVTAHAVVDVIAQMRLGNRLVVPLQVALDGTEWPYISGVLGVPVVVDIFGWHQTAPVELSDSDMTALRSAAAGVTAKITEWRGAEATT